MIKLNNIYYIIISYSNLDSLFYYKKNHMFYKLYFNIKLEYFFYKDLKFNINKNINKNLIILIDK